MIPWQKVDFVDFVQLVIVKNLHVFILKQIQINLVPVVANAHNKSTLQVEGLYFLMQRHLDEFFPTHFSLFYQDRKFTKRVLFSFKSVSH